MIFSWLGWAQAVPLPELASISNLKIRTLRFIKIGAQEAYEAGKALPKEEGFLVGISAGAALAAATQLAKLPENKGKNIVVLLPDSGDRYLSSEMFA